MFFYTQNKSLQKLHEIVGNHQALHLTIKYKFKYLSILTHIMYLNPQEVQVFFVIVCGSGAIIFTKGLCHA